MIGTPARQSGVFVENTLQPPSSGSRMLGSAIVVDLPYFVIGSGMILDPVVQNGPQSNETMPTFHTITTRHGECFFVFTDDELAESFRKRLRDGVWLEVYSVGSLELMIDIAVCFPTDYVCVDANPSASKCLLIPHNYFVGGLCRDLV